MAPSKAPFAVCDYCGKALTKKDEWVALNRHVVNGPDGWQMVSAGIGEDYVWDTSDRSYSCRTLCHPHCVLRWLDGEIIELRGKKKSG